MGREIRISIKSGFDPAGITQVSRAIDKMSKDLLVTNSQLSQAIRSRAETIAERVAWAADKGKVQAVLSAKEIEAAWARAMASSGGSANKGFGKIVEAARGALKGVGGAFSEIGNMFLQGGIWGAASAAVVRAFKWAWDKIGEGAKEAAERAKRANEEMVKSVKDGISSTAEAFNESAKSMDTYLSKFSTAIDKVKELTKAEVELARQTAIANGMDPGAANAAASDLNAQLDDEAAEEKLRREIAVQQQRVDAANRAESQINADLFKAMDAKERAEDEYRKKRNAKIEAGAKREGLYTNSYGGAISQTYVSAEEAARSREEVGRRFDESDEGQAMKKHIDALAEQVKSGEKEEKRLIEEASAAQAKIDNANTELETISTKRAARELAAENEIAQKIKEEDEKREETAKKAAEAEAKAKVEAAKKAAAEQERLDREAAVRRQQLADRELADKIKNHQKILQAEQGDAADARGRQSLAESKLQQAWGWYRDKDSMAAQMQEEKADAAARKQFEKDFEHLKGRKGRDWRTAENLTVGEEATRRVALAKEEKEAADKHLAEIEKNTADLAKKLDELLQVKG